MATKSRPYHQFPPGIMDPMSTQPYQPNEREQDEVYEEVVQQINPYYASMNFAIPAPDLPAAHSHFQAAEWQCQPDNMMWVEALQPWPTNGMLNTTAPVFSDWQTNATPTWDFQGHNAFAGLQDAQTFPIQSPSPTRVDNSFAPPPPQQFQQQYPANNTWTTGWVEEIPPTAPVSEVMPSVEAIPAATIHAPAPIHAPVPIPAQAAPPRRQRAPTPTIEFPEYATPVDAVPVQPLPVPVRVEKRRRAPTPTIEFEEYATPFYDTTPIQRAAIADTTPIQRAAIAPPPPEPLAATRPAPVRRDSPVKARRGSQTVFKTQSANSKRGHYASDVWERHKPVIQKLYIEEGKPLREVIRTMETEHKFPATQRMYKARFKQWGFVKNNTEKVVSQILKTKFQRDAAGKLSQFTRNGKDVNLQNYLQRKGMTEYDLVDFSTGVAEDSLVHVRCRTPPLDLPEDLRLPDRLRFQDSLVMSFKRAFLLWRQEEQESAFGLQATVFTWRVTDFPHLSNLIESARLVRKGEGAQGVAALNQAFWSMNSYFGSMDATSSFYFFFHRQSRCWQDDSRIALAVWKFLAAYASARNHNNHPLFHTFKLMYEVVQKEGVPGLRELLQESSSTVADELEKSFGRDHWLKDLIWHRCFPEKSKLRHLQLIRDLRDHGPTRKIVRRLY